MLKTTYNAIATLKWENGIVHNLKCEIHIDKESLDFFNIKLKLSADSFHKLRSAFKVKFNAKSGNISLFSKEAYIFHSCAKKLKSGQSEYSVMLELHDLIVCEPLYTGNLYKSYNGSISVIFTLSYNKNLPDNKILSTCYDGSVVVLKNKEDEFVNLGEHSKCRFDTYYDFEDERNIQVAIAKKVCIVSTKLSNCYHSTILKHVVCKIDDLLLLTSLFYRQRIIWNDFQYYANNKKITHYRRKYKKEFVEWEMSYPVGLGSGNLYEFLNSTFPVFLRSKYKNEIVKAIYALSLNYGKNLISESNFLNMFSSVERLVLKYRKLNNKEFIIVNESKWRKIRKEVVKTLKNNIQDEEQKKLVIDKIGELRRYPLRQAYLAFCEKYKIDLEILWALFYANREDKPGLGDLRNYLIHEGSCEISNVLIYANYNLQWTVERILLALLKWSLVDSNVSNRNLQFSYPVRRLKEVKKIAAEKLFISNN